MLVKDGGMRNDHLRFAEFVGNNVLLAFAGRGCRDEAGRRM